MKARPSLLALLVAVVGTTRVAPRAGAQEEEKQGAKAVTATVEVARPRAGRIAREVAARGTLEAIPAREVALSAIDAQPIELVSAEPGRAVRAGEVLVRLRMDPAPGLALERATIARRQAELQAGRLRRLVDAGVLPRVRLEEAEAALALASGEERAAGAELENARAHHVLVAPIDGVVTGVEAVVGALSDPARPLVRLSSDPAAVFARLLVPLVDAARVHSGQRVALAVPTSGARLAGAVASVGSAVVAAQHVVVRVTLDAADGLAPGAWVAGAIEVEVRERALLVPEAALRREGDRTSLFVVRNGHAALVEVALGLEGRDEVEVTAGLAAEDEVVVVGAYELEPGMAVKVASPPAPGGAAPDEGQGR